MEQLSRLQRWFTTSSNHLGEWVHESGDTLLKLASKGEPVWKHLKLMSVKLIDKASVNVDLLTQRFHPSASQKIPLLPNSNKTGLRSDRSNSPMIQNKKATSVLDDEVTSSLSGPVRSKSENKRRSWFQELREEIESLPLKDSSDNWWDDILI